MQIEHGTERSRKTITEHGPMVEAQHAKTGEKFSYCSGSHTYTQTEKFCRNCGWVTCNGILGAIICPSCSEQW